MANPDSVGKSDRTRALLWAAWFELNEIRARDGVPRDFYGHKASVSEEYFSDLVDAIAEELGEDAKPWCVDELKPAFNAALYQAKMSTKRSWVD